MAAAAREKSNKESKESKESKARKESKEEQGNRRLVALLFFVIVIVFAIAGALVYGLNASQGASLSAFENNFDAASNISIIVYANNNTNLAPPIDCAANLIEQLTSTHGAAHKDPTAINYYVMNQSICSYNPGGLNGGLGNSAPNTTTPSKCLALSQGQLRIFINYSAINKTTITPMALYISGNIRFLAQCGVASELTAG